MNGLSNILNFLVKVAFTFFGGKIKGARTAIVNITAGLIAAWEFISNEGVFELLCGLSQTIGFFSVFCNITETAFWSVILAITGALNLILKKLDASELIDRLPAAISAEYTQRVSNYNIGAQIASVALVGGLGVGIYHAGIGILAVAVLLFAIYHLSASVVYMFNRGK